MKVRFMKQNFYQSFFEDPFKIVKDSMYDSFHKAHLLRFQQNFPDSDDSIRNNALVKHAWKKLYGDEPEGNLRELSLPQVVTKLRAWDAEVKSLKTNQKVEPEREKLVPEYTEKSEKFLDEQRQELIDHGYEKDFVNESFKNCFGDRRFSFLNLKPEVEEQAHAGWAREIDRIQIYGTSYYDKLSAMRHTLGLDEPDCEAERKEWNDQAVLRAQGELFYKRKFNFFELTPSAQKQELERFHEEVERRTYGIGESPEHDEWYRTFRDGTTTLDLHDGVSKIARGAEIEEEHHDESFLPDLNVMKYLGELDRSISTDCFIGDRWDFRSERDEQSGQWDFRPEGRVHDERFGQWDSERDGHGKDVLRDRDEDDDFRFGRER